MANETGYKQPGVYLIRNTSNGKAYVGSSVNIHKRWQAHIAHLKANRHYNAHLQAAWNKYGKDVFEFAVIEFCSVDVLIVRETAWVEYYGSTNEDKGYNLAYPDRREQTEETKLKISKSRIGNPRCLGHRKSDELKRQLSKLHTGNKYRLGHRCSADTKKKMSEAHRGFLRGGHLSEEHKKKLSDAHRGKIPSMETRRILSEKTREYWERKHKSEVVV